MTDTPLVEAVGHRPARSAKRGRCCCNPPAFALHAGDRVAITGPSGSGKSVFLRALALLDPLDGGRIAVARRAGRARDDSALPAQRRLYPQRPAMLDGTVEDNLRYPFSLKVYRDVRFDRARAALARRPGGPRRRFSRQARERAVGRRSADRRADPRAATRPGSLAARRTDRLARPRVVARDRRPRDAWFDADRASARVDVGVARSGPGKTHERASSDHARRRAR